MIATDAKEYPDMSIPLADLSPTTLDCLAELIEQRLEDPEAMLLPATWQEAMARDDADRELVAALHAAGLGTVARALMPPAPPVLH